MEGSHAIAEAVRLCNPAIISAYPITPQFLFTYFCKQEWTLT